MFGKKQENNWSFKSHQKWLTFQSRGCNVETPSPSKIDVPSPSFTSCENLLHASWEPSSPPLELGQSIGSSAPLDFNSVCSGFVASESTAFEFGDSSRSNVENTSSFGGFSEQEEENTSFNNIKIKLEDAETVDSTIVPDEAFDKLVQEILKRKALCSSVLVFKLSELLQQYQTFR